MIFAVDMGNSNIVLGCLEGGKPFFEERLATNMGKTALEYAIMFKNLFELYGKKPTEVEGSIISSVVPQLTDTIAEAVEKVCGKVPMIVGPGIKSGINIVIDNPAQLGADLIAGAVAALDEYKAPLIIIDMGTATTFSYINEKRQFAGGAIMPGVITGLNSLVSGTSQLIRISLEAPKKVIGSNTIDSMKSGTVFGSAAMIDGMIERIEEEMGRKLLTVATGGLAKLVVPYCKKKIIQDDSLLIKGLGLIYEKNKK
nr:type III pantothenate kinase [uncultured Catonella sp.]